MGGQEAKCRCSSQHTHTCVCVALRYTTETVASMCLLKAESDTELEVFSQAQNNRRQPRLLLTLLFCFGLQHAAEANAQFLTACDRNTADICSFLSVKIKPLNYLQTFSGRPIDSSLLLGVTSLFASLDLARSTKLTGFRPGTSS